MTKKVIAMSAFNVSNDLSFGELHAFVDATNLQVKLNFIDEKAGEAEVSIMHLVNDSKQYQTQRVTGQTPVTVNLPDETTYVEINNQQYTGSNSTLFLNIIQSA